MDDEPIRKLACARESKEVVKIAMKKMIDDVTDKPEYKALEAELQTAMKEELEATSEVQLAALAEFESTGRTDKHPHPTITVKEMSKVEVLDMEKSREWCFENFKPALVLDDKAFKEMAGTFRGRVPSELIAYTTEYKATIARDLTDYLEPQVMKNL
jgi:hypothetical protein